jgi:EmrB/QacA subfamily drug resistance transporter
LQSSQISWAVLAVCALSMFLVGVDTTIVNVGLPEIGQGLEVGTRGLEWVVNAYTVVLASLLMVSGALADRFGRRRIFQSGLLVFGLASLACALAPSLGVLVAARAVQGVGASMLSPVALAIVVNAMPDPRERARAIGVWASVFGLSMAAGPVTGGALIAAFGWRSVFWINAPVAIAALVLVAVFVPESLAERARRPDLPGQVLLTMVLGLLVGVLIEGPRIGWAPAGALTGYALITAATAGFVLVELRRSEPLMDLGLFRRPPFATAVLGAMAVFVALNVSLLFNTLYLQHARGWTPLASGAATLPMALGATLCAPWAGTLVGRLGPRRPLILAGTFTSRMPLPYAVGPGPEHRLPRGRREAHGRSVGAGALRRPEVRPEDPRFLAGRPLPRGAGPAPAVAVHADRSASDGPGLVPDAHRGLRPGARLQRDQGHGQGRHREAAWEPAG